MKTGLHLKNKAGGGCMFQIGDEISYTNKGIFQVKEIINKRNRKREVESWYVLHSINNDVETSITTPVTNPNLRLMMSKEDILQLIEDMPTLETVWSDDRHVREDRFEKMLNSGDIRQWATMSKTIYEMKKQKEINKKNISERVSSSLIEEKIYYLMKYLYVFILNVMTFMILYILNTLYHKKYCIHINVYSIFFLGIHIL